MANTLFTPQIFTKLTLAHLRSPLNVVKNMSKEVSKDFGTPKNNKPGDTVFVRRPYRFLVTEGLAYQPQAITDTRVPVRLSRQPIGVHFEWDSVERTLSLREVSELYARPAAIALASKINADAAQFAAQNTANTVGTPGVVPADEQPYLQAVDILHELGMPASYVPNLVINRRMSSTFVHNVKTLFNPVGAIAKQWQQGEMVNSLGYGTTDLDETLYAHTVGALPGAPLVNGAGQVGAGGDWSGQTISIDGITPASGALKKGDVLTFDGCYAVHPQTRQSTGRLKQFVVTADTSDAVGAMATLPIFPSITPSGQYQNVSAAPADNAVVTIFGTAATVTKQGLVMTQEAFAFVSVPLANPEPSGVEMVAQETDPETGVTLAFIRAFDAVRRVHVNRFDCLYDFAPLYPEMACRICS